MQNKQNKENKQNSGQIHKNSQHQLYSKHFKYEYSFSV